MQGNLLDCDFSSGRFASVEKVDHQRTKKTSAEMKGRSSRELDRKELINQLLMTRGVVLEQLQDQERVGLISRRRSTTREEERAPKPMKLAPLAKNPLEDLSLTNPSNLIMAYPVSHFNTRKKAAVKLPIFRLPPAIPASVSPVKDAVRVATSSKKERGQKFIAYHDKRSMRKTLVLLINQLSPPEKEALTAHLQLQPTDIDECMVLMRDRFVELATQTFAGSRSIVADVFPVDESMTIFNTAQKRLDVMKEHEYEIRHMQQEKQKANESSVDSIRAISRGVDFQKVGISPQFQDFLTSDRISGIKSIPGMTFSMQSMSRVSSPPNQQQQHTKTLNPYNTGPISSPTLRRQSSLPAIKPAGGSSSNHGGHHHNNHHGGTKKKKSSQPMSDDILSSSDPKVLSKAFLTSLLAVQKHSSLVKKSLETAQTLVTIEDRRAKELVFLLGAERMQTALGRVLHSEQRRGWLAWTTFLQQERRLTRTQRLLKSLVLRNVLIALQNLVQRVLTRSFSMWNHFTQQELVRLRRERIFEATVRIQCCMRRYLAKKRVKLLKQRRKYEKVYDATVKLQTLFRCKLQRWRYLKLRLHKIQTAASILIQRVYRGWQARRRVHQMKLRRNRNHAATVIQRIVRGRQGRQRVQQLREDRRRAAAATKINAMVRGFLTRRNLARVLIDRARNHAATVIQRRVRGMITRSTIHRRIQEIQQYRAMRHRMATKIQACFRGYHDRILVKIRLMQQRKERQIHNAAATKIITMVRGFMARRLLQELRMQRFQQWLQMARDWQETWADNEDTWCYVQQSTGEVLWEPSRDGYTKADGRLVLYSGDIVDDPRKAGANSGNNGAGGDDDSQGTLQRMLAMAEDDNRRGGKSGTAKKGAASTLCSECTDRIAVRLCLDCNDQFCSKCYKQTHALGARRHHTCEPLGPKDCDECELVLAERHCVSCDENFCDPCWRKLHKHGKRLFHPYCEIARDGRFGQRIFTMDGDELSAEEAASDGIYAQQRVDAQRTQQENMLRSQQVTAYDPAASADMVPYYGDDQQQQQGEYGYDQSGYTYEQQQQGYDVSVYDASTTGGGASAGYAAEGGEWQAYQDEQGYVYYYNQYTGESTYDPPPGMGGGYEDGSATTGYY